MKEILGKIPKKVRYAGYALAATVGVVGTAACSSETEADVTPEPSPIVRVDPPEQVPVEPVNTDPNKFLSLPAVQDGNLRVQQGFVYNFETDEDHGGIDYISGQIDESSTWGNYKVFSAAPGEACVNPMNHQGLAVFVRHDREDGTYYTYYGHLKSAKKEIPQCKQKAGYYTETIHVESGQEIGVSGSDGVYDKDGNRQKNWDHLHFTVIGPDGGYLDPYDIYSTADDYGHGCGPDSRWIECPLSPDAQIAPTRETVSTVEVVQTQAPPEIKEITPGPDTIYCQVAGDVEFEGVEGETVHISDFRGKLVVLYYFQYPFPNKERALAEWNAKEQSYGGKVDLIYLLDSRLAYEEAGYFPKDTLIIQDPDDFDRKYDVRGVPSQHLIDEEGNYVASTASIPLPGKFLGILDDYANSRGNCTPENFSLDP